jgi:hypothetical protein
VEALVQVVRTVLKKPAKGNWGGGTGDAESGPHCVRTWKRYLSWMCISSSISQGQCEEAEAQRIHKGARGLLPSRLFAGLGIQHLLLVFSWK